MPIVRKVRFRPVISSPPHPPHLLVSQDLMQKATQLKLRLHMQQQQRSFNENTLNEKRQMYEDRIQIFNNEATRVNPSSSNSQRGSFQSSKSIDTDSPHLHPNPLPSKAYESMNNLAQKTSSTSNLKEKTPSRPKMPIIRDKSAPQAPHLNPALSRRTTSAGQQRADLERSKLKSFEEKYRKNNQRKRGEIFHSKDDHTNRENFFRTIRNTR